MANPLKVLTHLSASKAAQFAEVVEMQDTLTVSGGDLKVQAGEISGSQELKIGGAAQLNSTLAVAGNANLAAELVVVGAADLQAALDVAGIASFASDMSGAAGLDLVGAAHIGGALDLDGNLDVGGYAKVIGELSGSAALNIGGQAHVAGNAQFDAQLNVDGAADFDSTMDVAGNVTMQASASIAGDLDVDGAADVAGNLDVHGNAVIFGNLEVKGTMTTIESTTVTVADANIQLATVASPTDATADGAGITILGASNKTFQWNDDGHGFTSSEDMNLAADKKFRLVGEEALAASGSAHVLSKDAGYAHVAVSANAVEITGDLSLADDLDVAGYAKVQGEISGSAALNIGGNAHIAGQLDVDQAANFDGAVDMNSTLAVDGIASFASDISASAGLELLGAADLGSTLDVAGVASFASDITASANVDVAGNVNLGAASAYKIDGKEILSNDGMYTKLSNNSGNSYIRVTEASNINIHSDYVNLQGEVYATSTLNVDGVAIFNNDITASALRVQGVAEFVDTVNINSILNVSAQVNAASYNIDGAEIITNYGQSTSVFNSDASAFVRIMNDASEILLSGSDHVTIAPALSASSGLDVAGAAAFHADVAMDAALNLSGSAFTNITTPVVAGKYNVNDAIRALDTKVGDQGSNINANYAALRYLSAANFDANGMAAFTSSFAAADIEQVTVDVLVQAGGSGPWTNDLVSVQVKAAGSFVGFEISAPAMAASDKVRIIAVKESGSLA